MEVISGDGRVNARRARDAMHLKGKPSAIGVRQQPYRANDFGACRVRPTEYPGSMEERPNALGCGPGQLDGASRVHDAMRAAHYRERVIRKRKSLRRLGKLIPQEVDGLAHRHPSDSDGFSGRSEGRPPFEQLRDVAQLDWTSHDDPPFSSPGYRMDVRRCFTPGRAASSVEPRYESEHDVDGYRVYMAKHRLNGRRSRFSRIDGPCDG